MTKHEALTFNPSIEIGMATAVPFTPCNVVIVTLLNRIFLFSILGLTIIPLLHVFPLVKKWQWWRSTIVLSKIYIYHA